MTDHELAMILNLPIVLDKDTTHVHLIWYTTIAVSSVNPYLMMSLDD